MNTVIKHLLVISMVLGFVSRLVSADDDDWPFEDSYDETEACLAATGHCAETEYDVGWEDAVACVDAAYRKDPALKAQCCEYCDALARCAEGRTAILEYDDDGYYSTRAKNCKESKMCDSGDDGNDNDITWFDNDITSDSRSTTEPYCDTTGVEVSCGFNKLTKIPTFLNQDVTSIDLSSNDISELAVNVFAGLSSLTSLDLRYNAIIELSAGMFKGLSSLVSLLLGTNRITELSANTFQGLSSLATLDLSSNVITELIAHTFGGLSSLIELDLSGSFYAPVIIARLEAYAFQGLSSLTSLDLRGGNAYKINPISVSTADSFAGLDSLTAFPYIKLETRETQRAAIAFCSNATIQIPPLAVASTDFCAGYRAMSPEEMMFLAISASMSALAGVLVLVQLRCKKGRGGITCGDFVHVALFSSRIFDLFTDFGVYGFTAQKPDWDAVMNNEDMVDTFSDPLGQPITNPTYDDWATPVKYMSLISAIIGAVLFVPDIFVYARKLGLHTDGGEGGFFNLYKPSQKAAIVIMSATLLLESIPQLLGACMIIDMYSMATDISLLVLPIVSVVLTCNTILSDSVFLFKLCCGKRCCSCCCTCCHCDVSGLFEANNEEQPSPGLPLQAHRQVPQPVAALNLNAVAVLQSPLHTMPTPKSFGVEETALGMLASSKGNVGNLALLAYPSVPGYSPMARRKSLVLSNASAMTGTSLTDGEILNSTAPPPAESRDGNAIDNVVVATYHLATASRNVETAKPPLNQKSSIIINPALSAKTPPPAFGIEGNALGTPKQIAGKHTANYFFASATPESQDSSNDAPVRRQTSDV